MNEKDAEVYHILAELDLLPPPSSIAEELSEAYRRVCQTKEETFLMDVERLFQSSDK